jgi:hypothetical protein
MLMMRSIVRAAVSVGALATLAACSGSDAATGVRASVTGNYQLSTVNGQPLPFTENSSGAVIKVTAGSLVAESNGAFTETITRSTTPPGGATTTTAVPATGTFTVSGSVIVFTFVGANGPLGTLLGTVTSSGVSIQNGSDSFEFKKQ